MIEPKSTHREPSSYAIAVLLGLGARRTGGNTSRDHHVYESTVPEGVKQERRRRNRQAGRSRRINRMRRSGR